MNAITETVVLIIGAGMSGLSAAYSICKSNKNVIVLEARDRIGGRLSSERFSDGLLFERGGELIHGTTNQLYALVRDLGIEIKELKSKPERTPVLETVVMLIVAVLVRSGWYAKPRVDENLKDYLDRLRLLPRSVKRSIEQRSMDFENLDRVSALHIVERFRRQLCTGEVYGDHDFLIKDGYATVLRHLAKDIPIRFGHVATKIEWNRDAVVVRTNRGDYGAEKLVVTVPVSVLPALEFEPELPATKVRAISAHTALDIVKLIVPVPERSFKTDQDQGIIPEAKIVPMWWRRNLATGSPDGRQVLVGWITGEYAREFCRHSPEESKERALAELSAVVDLAAVDRDEVIAQNWTKDEFARGPYSYIRPGFDLDIVDELAAPLAGTVYFAGTETAEESGTAHGAYESGLRAAREVLAQTDL